MSAPENLALAWQAMQHRWLRTREVWADKAQRDFEQEYWLPLEQETRATSQEMTALMRVIAEAHRRVK